MHQPTLIIFDLRNASLFGSKYENALIYSLEKQMIMNLIIAKDGTLRKKYKK